MSLKKLGNKQTIVIHNCQGSSPCKTEFPDIRKRRQLLDHYVKDIAKITQQYGIYTIGISTLGNKKYVFQTDDLDLQPDPLTKKFKGIHTASNKPYSK